MFFIKNCNCKNGACTESNTGIWACSCNEGFTGINCDVKISKCKKCIFGTCDENIGKCICKDDYEGDFCDAPMLKGTRN